MPFICCGLCHTAMFNMKKGTNKCHQVYGYSIMYIKYRFKYNYYHKKIRLIEKCFKTNFQSRYLYIDCNALILDTFTSLNHKKILINFNEQLT